VPHTFTGSKHVADTSQNWPEAFMHTDSTTGLRVSSTPWHRSKALIIKRARLVGVVRGMADAGHTYTHMLAGHH
jgi:hypothetical protein